MFLKWVKLGAVEHFDKFSVRQVQKIWAAAQLEVKSVRDDRKSWAPAHFNQKTPGNLHKRPQGISYNITSYNLIG